MTNVLKTALLILGIAAASPAYADDRSKVTVEFDPVTADMEGARWRLVPAGGQPTTWQRSSATLVRVPDGLHRLEYQDPRLGNPTATCAPPPTTSEAREIFVRPGVAHHVVAPFECAVGMVAMSVGTRRAADRAASLSVVLEPGQAASNGAAWSIDGGAWQDSGAVVADVTDGDHVLRYKPVTSGPCTVAPEREVIAVYLGGVTTLTRRYGGQGC